jgi:hypothetical protein
VFSILYRFIGEMSDKWKGFRVDADIDARIIRLMLVCIVFCCAGCGEDTKDPVETRSFRMGASPFFASFDGSQAIFPDWRFENPEDRDLLSLHVDDFWGVPWDYCDATACSSLPLSWIDQWRQLADAAKATAKPIYLALSPLGGRRTLAPEVLPDGSTRAGWNSNIDGNGCYRFDSDVNAAHYKASYISYLRYIIDLVNPDYFSPAVEMNMPFTNCPMQKSAWIAWYNDVHVAIKAAYPQLIVFPTFQLEHMYGISDDASACSSGTLAACFDSRLEEVVTIPADRIAFSSYPSAWVYHAEFDYSFPRDTFAKIAQATTRKIWLSETGWPAMPVLSSYEHDANGSCGELFYPSTLEVPQVGLFDLANDAAHADYMTWLLNEAQQRGLEAVVWWLNRDYLDDAVTGNGACPCLPPDNSTCLLLDQFFDVSGNTGEILQRMFGNMALRYHDGSPRPGQEIWQAYIRRPYRP